MSKNIHGLKNRFFSMHWKTAKREQRQGKLWSRFVLASVSHFVSHSELSPVTRMHSSGISGMRTARLLTVSQHALWQGGCTCPGGILVQGMYLPGGQGCTCRGVCTCPGWGVPTQVLPPVNRMTDRQM